MSTQAVKQGRTNVRLPGRSKGEKQEPAPKPETLPQRWVLILAISTAVGIMVGAASVNVGAGVGAGSGLALLLHNVMS